MFVSRRRRVNNAPGVFTFTNTEASDFVARITTPPSLAYKAAYDTLIGAFKTAGIWTKCDAIYMHAAPDAQAAKLNLKGATYNATDIGTPTFTAGVGYTGTGVAGTTDRLDTNFNASTAGGLYAQNSCHTSVWVGNDTLDTNFVFGSTNLSMQPRFTGNLFTGRNQAGSASNAPSTNSKGLFQVSRTASGGGSDFRRKNGVALSVSSGATSGALTNANFHILGASGGATTGLWIASYVSFGSGLTVTENLDEYNAVFAYLTAIGYPNF